MDPELIDIPDDEVMLTTMDNPFNPKEDYNKWRNWDIDNDYYTEELIDRIANIPNDVEDPATINRMTLDAILAIVQDEVFGPYKLI